MKNENWFEKLDWLSIPLYKSCFCFYGVTLNMSNELATEIR